MLRPMENSIPIRHVNVEKERKHTQDETKPTDEHKGTHAGNTIIDTTPATSGKWPPRVQNDPFSNKSQAVDPQQPITIIIASPRSSGLCFDTVKEKKGSRSEAYLPEITASLVMQY